MTSFRCGPYTVRQEVRISDRLLHYVISRAGKIIGHSASCPDLGWCEAIERLEQTGRYAEAPVQKYNYRLRGRAANRSGRPTNAARAKAAADLLKIPDDV
jgi:hypothetical protein